MAAEQDMRFPPGYLDKAQQFAAGSARASIDPLPGPLVDAFLPEPLRAAGLELRPLVMTDIALLKRLDHPILRELAELQKPEGDRKPVPFGEEDMLELLYCWTRPVREARAALAGGRQAFREIALSATGDLMPAGALADTAQILEALGANFRNAFATALRYQAKSPEGGAVFTKPPASGQPMASAGG